MFNDGLVTLLAVQVDLNLEGTRGKVSLRLPAVRGAADDALRAGLARRLGQNEGNKSITLATPLTLRGLTVEPLSQARRIVGRALIEVNMGSAVILPRQGSRSVTPITFIANLTLHRH